MKVLLVPFAAMAATEGSFSRVSILAEELKRKNVDVLLCAAKDVNYKDLAGIETIFIPVPQPLGLPAGVAKHVFPIAQKLGITKKKRVNTFEEVLFLTGNIQAEYLVDSITAIREIIRAQDIDIVYSEFNISAMIAAVLEKKKLCITVSIPTQNWFRYTFRQNSNNEIDYEDYPLMRKKYQEEFARNATRFVQGTNKAMHRFGLPEVKSSLDVFDFADLKFVPSCFALEPFPQDEVTFCGAWNGSKVKETVSVALKSTHQEGKNKIIVYLGNTISDKAVMREIELAFENKPYEIFAAGPSLTDKTMNNIHFGHYYNFKELLPDAVLFINHAGQNSITDGLVFGVPQLMYAGNAFERNYNADSVVRNGAGVKAGTREFSAKFIADYSEKIINEYSFTEAAQKLGSTLISLGGAAKAASLISEIKAEE